MNRLNVLLLCLVFIGCEDTKERYDIASSYPDSLEVTMTRVGDDRRRLHQCKDQAEFDSLPIGCMVELDRDDAIVRVVKFKVEK
jgi:hypothetical protein